MLASCLIFVGAAAAVTSAGGHGFDAHLRGPSFVIEPPSRVEFSNSSGAWLDCTATGSPPPNIDWSTADGHPVNDVPGVRRVLRNGTLVLLPFPAAAFRQDVHSAAYRCVASNSVGRVLSRDVQVRAVVAQAYKVDVEVIGGASRGCTAVLRCVVPSFVKDLVRVVSWLQEPSFYIYPSLQGDGKFHLLPTGELLVHSLEFSDQIHGYRCRTMHRLTRQVVVSSVANVRIADHRGVMPPVILENSGVVHVAQDESTSLVCVAQACPTPEYRWYAQTGSEPMLVLSGPRTRLLGSVLALEAVTLEDSGIYRCSASNPGGEASAEIRLIVTAPLHIEVTPPLLSVHLGGNAEFRCEVSTHPQAGPHFVTWYKDGRQLPGSGRQSELLRLNGISREDRGMYQCIVRRAEGDTAQASAELQLGDAPPMLLYSFIEQTLQPGPAVSLKCSAAGNPTPQVSWALDGFPLPTNGRFVIGQYVTVHGDVISHVNISHVMVEDGGEYSCTAENRAGKVTHAARLNVYGLPYIRLIPKVTAVAGETLRLKCPVAGYPIEEIKWERANRELPDDLRQKVLKDGTLVITSVQKKGDAGVYTCSARNKQGHNARRSGDVAVIVPPIIEPFTFQEGLSEGMRTRTVCGVAAGDPPLTISWLKDGQSPFPLPPNLASVANISQLDPYSSLLSITNLAAEHSGDYTCVAANPAAEVRYTAKLQVKVPPRWIVEPADVSVERNKHVALHCQAQGVPTPTIVWKKATGSKSGEYEELRERAYTKILSNGTLLLQHVKEDREGFYLCQASNGIGSGIGKVVQLKVNSSPYFAAPSRLVTVKKGDTATLHCEVHGDTPVSVTWLKGGKIELNPSTNYRVTVKREVTPDGVIAQLQISSAEASDSGAYFCQASNLYGRDQQLVQLLVQEPPQPPSSLETAMVASRSINVKWQHKSQDTSEVTKYILQYKEGDAGMWQQQEFTGPPLSYAALIDELKPATRYTIRVIAEGPAGRSVPSAELIVRTEPQRPAGPPINLEARALSSSEILITWSPPLPELRHGDIQGFNVGYRETSSANPSYNFSSVSGDGEEGGAELRLTGLRPYTKYTLVVQAYNQVGSGPLSEPLFTQTMEDVPSMPPEDVRCAALTSQSLQVSWQPPPNTHSNGIIQGYKLHYEPILADMWRSVDEMEVRKTNVLTIILTGLRKYTNYTIQVLAFTRVGDGVPTTVTYCQTEEDVPGSPADIKVVVSSPQALFISWLPPLEPNGIITKYNLYTRVVDGREELNHGKRTLPATSTYFEATDLQQHVEYQFWVTGSTRVGEGQSSRVAAQVPTNRVPARITSFGGHVVRPWRGSATLACNAVGDPTREWYKGQSEQIRTDTTRNIQILPSGELVLSNLQSQDGGNYTCQVENAQGSDKLHYTLTAQVPPSAPVLYVTSSTSSSILLHWKPGHNGGASLTGYTLHYRTTHGNLDELQLSRHATSHELKGLLCGNTYQLYLTSHNKIGSSPSSPVLSVRTQGQAPGIPPAAAFLSPNSTTLVLRLHVWPDNGCPILFFVIQYRPINEFHWTLVSNSVKMQRRFVVTNLQPSSVYQLKVEAHNVAGNNQAEFTFVTLTKEGEPPPPELSKRGIASSVPFYADVKVMLPLIVATVALVVAVVIVGLRWRNRYLGDRMQRPMKETQENQQNAETQRERYYATIHKVALQQAANTGGGPDKIPGEPLLRYGRQPETAEDISPYATFQLSEGGGGSLAGLGGLGGLGGAAEASAAGLHPNNTLLHSFMYHEHAMTEGCASPPPAATSMKSVSSRRRQQRKQQTPGDVETDESESDPDQLTSSRTESSNQLDAGKLKHIRAVSDFIYHGTSSTSSDISPMSEQKSLPRRGRSRWHVPSRSSLRTLLPPISVAETTFVGGNQGNVVPGNGDRSDRPELSEAECDIDSLKKLKLGLRSSLWSRPSTQNNPSSDYSIAV
ncbi:Down syndrome cell adhesion molecule-like protein Dscam2 isoform X1 [Bombus vosnesenskii]|uniref:Down syndrome cell adhesion molecule-like protein Dscam2 isoform X1 n=2 Tax=Pyrobombus TaxID=144703 RepID=A0A6J3K963_9HYME|nr:Down syndrome cell adhesion molecule-like protein Dscam2 isoform X1 [Bombus vancouverensis nearcticus]XP_033316759.1 Down syndrome cell adhesion molecule-like protein Dscam2 isoform X1 [Bombus bifarius]XP_033349041.1 Down syndrome cell adhesion molecule-like protein Dscam2 isoform X1 [Bombus vosnesenskii]XP_050496935.1 cell adhesion molecule Dscam2 isoform X1 [Bombus huntii]